MEATPYAQNLNKQNFNDFLKGKKSPRRKVLKKNVKTQFEEETYL